jgi:hypothetical protein
MNNDDIEKLNNCAVGDTVTPGYSCDGGPCDDAETGMDAAEADYRERITEFVPVVQPGMVQVSARGKHNDQ